MFLPLTLGVSNLVYHVREPKWLHIFLKVIVAVLVLSHLVLRSDRYGANTIVRYSGGQITGSEFMEAILPDYQKIASVIEYESAKTLRVGTFIPYFIKNNDRLLINDSQLDIFSCIDMGQDDAVTLERLRKLGIKYIILDLNVATIEKDLNGTLHQKANRFVQFARSNLKILLNNMKLHIAFIKVPE